MWTCSRRRRGLSISYRSRNAMPDLPDQSHRKRPASAWMSEITCLWKEFPYGRQRSWNAGAAFAQSISAAFRRCSPPEKVAFRYDGFMGDLATLQEKQAEAARFATEMATEKDPQRLQQMAEQLQARCAELGRMAKALEAAVTPAGASGTETRVALTAEQRERIAEQTGAAVETVTLQDTPDRAWSKQMPKVEPREVEAMAAKQAAASRLRAETRAQAENIIRELEKLDVPELADTIAGLRRDYL